MDRRGLQLVGVAGAVGVGGDQPRPGTDRLEGSVELGIVERTIERDDDPSHALVRPYLEPMGAQLADQGRLAEARDLLAPVYGWFTEGFGTPVLQEAKALLDELS